MFMSIICLLIILNFSHSIAINFLFLFNNKEHRKKIRFMDMKVNSSLKANNSKWFSSVLQMKPSFCGGLNPNLKVVKTDVFQLNQNVLCGVSLEHVREFFKVFSPRNLETKNIILNADFDKYLKEGIPLKYARKDFISDVDSLLKSLGPIQKKRFCQKLCISPKFDKGGCFVSYEGVPELKKLNFKNKSEIQALDLFEKFIYKNEFVSENAGLNKVMNAIIRCYPEFINAVGKKQHDFKHPVTGVATLNKTVDVHIMDVFKAFLLNPKYDSLSDMGKTVAFHQIIFHDLAKIENVLDKSHPEHSAEIAKNAIERVKMPIEVKNRIVFGVKWHHWLEEYSVGIPVGQRTSPEEIAVRFRHPEDYEIAKILTESDLKGVNQAFYDVYGGQLSNEKLEPIEAVMRQIHSTGAILMPSRIVNKNKIPEVVFNGSKYHVLDLTKFDNNVDMEKFGFPRATKKEDLRFVAHFLPESAFDDIALAKAMSEPEGCIATYAQNILKSAQKTEGGLFSASFISPDVKKSFGHRGIGLSFNVNNFNVATARNFDQFSSSNKNFINFVMGATSKFNNSRVFLRNFLLEKLEDKFGIINYNEYMELFNKLANKKYISQINRDVSVGDKKLLAEDLKNAIINTQDELLRMPRNDQNEVLLYQPEVSSIVCKTDSLDNIPDKILKLSKEENLPIILIGE